MENKYDEIGPLSGSSGTEYYCNLCGDSIGRMVFKRS
jgi:hypothetical protein